jgi:WD40-like Beta Propeller Repeat
MRQLRIAGAVTLIAGSLAFQAHVGAQATREAEKQFKAAQYRQEVQGDLKGAIEEYKKVAQSPDRTLAARALLAMGETYQTLGAADARGVFAQIVNEFTVSKEVVTAARARLAALAPAKRQTDGPTPRRILADEVLVPKGISADGHLVVGNSANGRDLLMRDLSTNQTTRLVAGLPQTTFVGNQRFSPDNRQVAYGYADRASGTQPFSASLRVIGTQAGSEPRTLVGPVRDPDTILAADWSPDGKAVLAAIGRSIAWVSVADGTVRTIKSWEQGQGPTGVRLSPDGSSIAIAAPPRPGSTDRHIYVIDSNGENETDVVKIAGINTVLMWTPDGGHILFISDRSGTRALWSVAVRGGKAVGEPSMLRSDLASIHPALPSAYQIGMNRSGDLYFELGRGGDMMTFVAERSPRPVRAPCKPSRA